ncbi:hypothetical protein N9P79_01130 [Crocinitomicaceae bacterium]|nr:hypothetical protein [Crocinitomicaceae bacterium]
MNDNSKSSIRRFSIEQKRMADKLRNAEVGLKGAYNTLEDINRAYRHQENSKQRLMDQINKLKPMHQIATIHGMRTVGSPTADADKAIMLESMEHYLNLHNNDSLLRELGKKIHTSGRNLDGSISNEERIMRNQALIFKNKDYTRHQKRVSTRHRNRRRRENLPPMDERDGDGSNRRKTKRKKHKRKKHKREKHKRKKHKRKTKRAKTRQRRRRRTRKRY